MWKGDVTYAFGVPLVDQNLTLITIQNPVGVVRGFYSVWLTSAIFRLTDDSELFLEPEEEIHTPVVRA